MLGIVSMLKGQWGSECSGLLRVGKHGEYVGSAPTPTLFRKYQEVIRALGFSEWKEHPTRLRFYLRISCVGVEDRELKIAGLDPTPANAKPRQTQSPRAAADKVKIPHVLLRSAHFTSENL